MTWEQLKAHIEVMDDKQKNTDVTFFDNRSEFYSVKSIEFADSKTCDVLDHNHPYLTCL